MAAITASDCFRFKLLHILETAGQKVLTYALLCGTAGKAPTDTLEEYLRNLPQGSTANYTKEKNPSKCFHRIDLEQIRRDPSCTTFDITLLHKAIKLACEGVAHPGDSKWNSASLEPQGELEHFVTKIRDAKNQLVHENNPFDEAAFQNRVGELSQLFVSALEATRDRYTRDNVEYLAKKDEVLATVRDIQEADLGEAQRRH